MLLGRFRSAFTEAFLSHFNRAHIHQQLEAVITEKRHDDHIVLEERIAMRRLVET